MKKMLFLSFVLLSACTNTTKVSDSTVFYCFTPSGPAAIAPKEGVTVTIENAVLKVDTKDKVYTFPIANCMSVTDK